MVLYMSADFLKQKGKAAPIKKCGGLAQLGERLPYKQRVRGSSPLTSTIDVPT